MRIIDKNKDYYDYIQYEYIDDTFTFDRRDSFTLTKEGICNYTFLERGWQYSKPTFFLVLQICNSFWILKLNPIEKNNFKITKYNLELVAHFKDYNKDRKMIELSLIESGLRDNEEGYINTIKRREYSTIHIFNKATIDRGDYRFKEEKHIPILKDTGIPSLVNGHDIYLALEEYFGAEKTAEERTEPLGATNDDKITAHGFDTVTSFRGK